MSNIILPANTLASGESLRVATALNFMGSTANARFQRTNASSGSSTQATLSAWVKYQTEVSQSVPIFMAPDAAGNDRFYINITSAEEMGGTHRYPDCDFSSTDGVKLRDPAAWYHIVAVINTNDGTAADRLKIYVNNQRITLTFATGGGLGSGANIHFNTSGYKNIFGYNDITNDGVQNLTDMYFAEVIKCDGQVLAPTDFAEYDDNGIWVPKTDLDTSLTFGTTGYYYNFADSGDLGNDVSGNGNDASDVSNTTQSLDTPSINYATLNPANQTRFDNDGVYSNGNTKLTMTSDNALRGYGFATFGVTQGKWYWEVKVLTAERAILGVGDAQFVSAQTVPFFDINPSYSVGLNCPNGALNYNGTSNSSYHGTAVSSGSIIQFALDMDNYLFWYGINGTWLNSATQTEIENGTATNDVTTAIGTQNVINNGEPIFPFVCDVSGTGKSNFECNFGNPQFTISSGNSDGNGYGNFEYSVPSGYYALNTKNLAEYG